MANFDDLRDQAKKLGKPPVPLIPTRHVPPRPAEPEPSIAPESAQPSSGPPRTMSPPPVNIPTTKHERELVAACAQVAELEQRLASLERRQQITVTTPDAVRTIRLDVKTWLAVGSGLMALVLGGWAKYDASQVPTTKVEAHGELIADEGKKSDKIDDRTKAILKYEEDLAAAYDCRFRQAASAVERTNGYRLGFASDGVEWQSTCLSAPGHVCRGLLYQAKTCPELPEIPK